MFSSHVTDAWILRTKRYLSCLIVAAVAAWASARTPYSNGPPIRSDGVGYHLWIRAILSCNLSFCDYDVPKDASGIVTIDSARGLCVDKYPPGVAFLRFPIVAPLVDLRPGAPVIGRSEHRASLWYSAALLVVLSVCGLVCAQRAGAPLWAAHVSVLSLVFGTGLFHYATYDGSFSHIHSAALLSLFLLMLQQAALRPGGPPKGWGSLVGWWLLSFLLLSVRSTNLLPVGFLLGAYVLSPPREQISGTRAERLRALVLPVGAGLVSAQLIISAYLRHMTGHWAMSGYSDAENFLWSRPMAHRVLLSYERGLFTYYPVAAIALGVALVVRSTRWFAVVCAALIGALALLYGFWDSWMLGGGFGHRGFVEVMPLLIPVFAVALPQLSRPWRMGVTAVSAVAVFVTLELMTGYWRGTIPFQHTTSSLYWSHVFGKRLWLAFLQVAR